MKTLVAWRLETQVIQAVRDYAAEHGVTLGEAAAQLIMRGKDGAGADRMLASAVAKQVLSAMIEAGRGVSPAQ